MAKRERHANTADSGRVLTVPNLITFLRLALVPVAYSLLVSGDSRILAFAVFAVAAATDWVDGQVARATNSVSKLGKELDPLVDRLLIASGVIGLAVVGTLPFWVMVILVVRDAVMLVGSARLKLAGAPPIPVMFVGKLTTALLMVGFSGLILGWPMSQGLGITSVEWLPGLNGSDYAFWMWFVYAAIPLSVISGVIYSRKGAALLRAASMSRG